MIKLNRLKGAVKDIIRRAGEKLLLFNKSSLKFKEKSERNFVTNADLEIERFICARLREITPTYKILTEEAYFFKNKIENYVFSFDSSFDKSDKCNGYTWVIDPLDGTVNFMRGLDFYAISVALLKDKDDVIFGCVYLPSLGLLYEAAKGEGSYENGKRIFVSSTSRLDKAVLATGFPYGVSEKDERVFKYFKICCQNTLGVRRCGSAVIDMVYTAKGIFDGFWEIGLSPWDTAAGWLILTEAGGKVSDFAGREYNVFKKEILATNGRIHRKLINLLNR